MKEVSENNMYNITVKRNIFTAKSTNKNRKIKRPQYEKHERKTIKKHAKEKPHT